MEQQLVAVNPRVKKTITLAVVTRIGLSKKMGRVIFVHHIDSDQSAKKMKTQPLRVPPWVTTKDAIPRSLL
jgi:hypothetical protein